MKIQLVIDNVIQWEKEVGGVLPGPTPPLPPLPPTPPLPPSPTGSLGSEGNPIPLVTPIPGINSYGYDQYHAYPFAQGQTLWFSADPLRIEKFKLNYPVKIGLNVLDMAQFNDSFEGKTYIVNRATGVKTPHTDLVGSQTGTSLWNYTRDPNLYIVFSVTAKMGVALAIYWKGN